MEVYSRIGFIMNVNAIVAICVLLIETDYYKAKLNLADVIVEKNETHNIAEWARIYNQNPKLVQKRLRANWDFEKALLTPPMRKY